MNPPSLVKFENHLKPEGFVLLNSSPVDPEEASRREIELLPIPLNEIASQLGTAKFANMVALGAYAEKTRVIREASIPNALGIVLDERHHGMILSDVEAIRKGRGKKTTIVALPYTSKT
jgi:2-oxoglutarate ferredoxin oxidoreductase subunit gamma